MSSFPEYFRKFHPRKSKPSSMCTILVFASDSRNPRSARKCFYPRSDFVFQHLLRSTCNDEIIRIPYYADFQFPGLATPHFASRCATSSVSNPFSVQFASAGLMMPPCGVPAVVASNCFRRLHRTSATSSGSTCPCGCCRSSIVIDVIEEPFDVRIQHPLCRNLPARLRNICDIASAVERFFLNPYEFGSLTVSKTGSSASKCSACMARSRMVGMPKGRNFPFGFGNIDPP